MKSSERNIDNLHEMCTGTPSHYKAEGKSSILLDKPSFYTLNTKRESNPANILSYYLNQYIGCIKFKFYNL